jgi:hypothetical protein
MSIGGCLAENERFLDWLLRYYLGVTTERLNAGDIRLSLEQRARLAVRDAKSEMTPIWIATMRSVSSGRKLANANALFISMREALYLQECRRGRDKHAAWARAIERLLKSHDRS